MAESNSQPVICPCGFFGSAQTLGLCSKCFRESADSREQTSMLTTADLRSHYNNSDNDNYNNDSNNYNNDNYIDHFNTIKSDDEDDDEDDEDYDDSMANADLTPSSFVLMESSPSISSSSLSSSVSSSSSASHVITSNTDISYAMIQTPTNDDDTLHNDNNNHNYLLSSLQASPSKLLSTTPNNPPLLPTLHNIRATTTTDKTTPIKNSTSTYTTTSNASVLKTASETTTNTTTHTTNNTITHTTNNTTNNTATHTSNNTTTHTTTNTSTHTNNNTTTHTSHNTATYTSNNTTTPINEPTDAITNGTTKASTIENNPSPSIPVAIGEIKTPKNRLAFPRHHSDSMINRNLKRKFTEAFTADDTKAACGQGTPTKSTKKCYVCSAKLDLALQTIGKCKCEFSFCSLHRLPEQHQCTYDHKESSRNEARSKMVVFKKHVGTALKRLDNDF